MTKIALGIEYDGSHYYGWQRQPQVKTIQACLELALTKVAYESIHIYCAGRTDAGVHATGQVIHFETSVIRQDAAWTIGVNSFLPSDIAVQWYKIVEPDFHARFCATARRYRYIIFNYQFRPAILAAGVMHFYLPLDSDKMHRAAQALVGKHDFTSFRAVQCQSKSPWRNVKHVHVNRYGHYIVVDITADAFVHHMVRNIVGSLLIVGCGDQDVSWIEELLALKDRTKAAATAKAEGLYLVSVDYPVKYKLPKMNIGPLFLSE
ncbi:tRNA pseudouridine synthase A [Arsenophonus endosymbiont of Aleurodicus dispersus]|uniref:tRNA pseudouridine(38-40) synthase TruA n=1 Tax=Arsenophonus endosymbiont of Aleurodicus dispersus TaxID=235559 RepID=UPI000EB402A8|nr:tRNA pseudouridine(38-40) synthase TruA [Arsenophonus endosymbiont of Aleurodicus dispersus]VAY02318.1 tRNA pseudouridine synthase A [Arsenophonus endosymbiont of Aleurodicus dispersus]